MEYVHRYASPLGGVTLASDGTALTGLWFDGQKYFASTLDPLHEEKNLPVFDAAVDWLNAYFSGSNPGPVPPLAPAGTPFQRAVWEILLSIPYGQTVTYGAVANVLSGQGGRRGAAARAVGSAVGRNPISLFIPCHRVVGADGGLTGYAGGLERKRALLRLEQSGITGP
ncbi:MAG: methylated-DNA--[Oscillospiraceae bacterium]|nr:methylated-DNA--[protein]-cysteine S-methyltransferase [Oscillospiraceae bacterium]